MTKAQFESTPEFEAYAKAYAKWQAGEATIAAVYYCYVILDNMYRKTMRKTMRKAK